MPNPCNSVRIVSYHPWKGFSSKGLWSVLGWNVRPERSLSSGCERYNREKTYHTFFFFSKYKSIKTFGISWLKFDERNGDLRFKGLNRPRDGGG